MSNPNGAALSGQASDSGGTGQAPQVNNSGSPTAASQGQAPSDNMTMSSAGDTISRAEHDRITADLRKEAASYRTKAKQFEDAQAAADLAKLGDLEKAQKIAGDAQTRALELELRLQQNELRLAAYDLAPTLGITDIRLALAAVVATHAGEIAYDDKTGTPTNLEALLQAVITEHPQLAAAPTAQSTQTAGPNSLQSQVLLQPGQYQRPPVQSGPSMSPGANAAPVTQPANRPLRTFNDVTWKR